MGVVGAHLFRSQIYGVVDRSRVAGVLVDHWGHSCVYRGTVGGTVGRFNGCHTI